MDLGLLITYTQSLGGGDPECHVDSCGHCTHKLSEQPGTVGGRLCGIKRQGVGGASLAPSGDAAGLFE